MLADTKAPQTDMRKAGLVAVIGSIALVLILIFWSVWTGIAGAVVAQGTVSVDGKPKSVQHLDGGIVGAILVTEGQHVDQGQLLIRLDDTLLRANLKIYFGRYAEAITRRDRLLAERDGTAPPAFSDPSIALGDIDLSSLRQGEVAIFSARAEIQSARRAQTAERISQFRSQIDGITALLGAKRAQEQLVVEQLDKQRKLVEKNLVTKADILSLEQSRAQLLGEITEQLSEIARLGNSIRDAELEQARIEQQFREEAVTELRSTVSQIDELDQQIASTRKQLERIDIVAPVSGYLHELQIVTVGGVVPPGAVIAQIIPDADVRTFELHVAPTAVDQVYPGQAARLRFSAFNHRTTPEIYGEVALISPTTVTDQATQATYYKVQVTVAPAEISKLGSLQLIPGMPIEAFLGTDERSVASYLLRPVLDQMQHAFREE
ncbi:HlyD family type I secretion periplasmic adaptor subunit [Frigidibacter sp. RF13]|uniref:HlyD family type I secretion periplasmic adaptor subunit n=1 Tax=Frigidibacter sp. RF13 TaxID=2997340 RepID=UPI0022713F47|nr:HlyD family type I secretion periplasmic adaptor subunit [Frigidibacter sp. RF13]MCY1128429.1 HlyD family type I secretion periplasmic adaptor subunit [Frigidibacter sp. RF13]